MTISVEHVARAVHDHEEYVSRNRPDWMDYRSAYIDKYWHHRHPTQRRGGRRNPNDPVRIQINLVRPWVNSFVASLFYKGIKTNVRPDDVIRGEEETNPIADGQRIGKLLDRWLSSQHAEMLAQQGFTMGLMYPESAYKLGIDETKEHPVDQVTLEIMPPWECVWDRKSRNKEQMRFIGRLHHLSKEAIERLYGVTPAKLMPGSRPDVVKDGLTLGVATVAGDTHSDESYVKVLEFYDFTAVHIIEGEKTMGEMRVYLLDQNPESKKIEENLWEVLKAPMPYMRADGGPMAPIIPIVLANVPEYPLMGLSPVATIYEINSEINLAHTMMAQAFRRDLGRVLLYLKDRGMSKEVLDAIQSGQDFVLAGVDGETLEGMTKWLEQQPVHPSLLTYLNMLDQSQDKTNTTAPFTRGQPLRYASATEVDTLNDYTETALGEVRKRSDKIIGELCEMYLRVLESAMGDTKTAKLTIRDLDEPYELKRSLFDMKWFISLSDRQATPLSEQQRRAEFGIAAPQLIQLAQVAEQGGPIGKLAILQMKELIVLYDLPKEMEWESLVSEGDQEQVDQLLALAEGADMEQVAGEIEQLQAVGGGGAPSPL